jgi:hypothetical protein
MSFAVDTNILLYAVNQSSEYHRRANGFVEARARGTETWAMPWPVLHAFLRISTHPAILPHPLTPAQAVGVVDDLLDNPCMLLLSEGDGFWKDYKADILSLHLKGNAMPDTQIVALLKSNGVTLLYSKDRDFLRFKGIKVIDPLDPA